MKSTFTTFLILFFSTVSLSLAQNLNDGLVAHYLFDGNVADSSGNDNNATAENIELTSDRFGNSDKAYMFSGSQSYVKLPSDFDYQERSVSIWFMVTGHSYNNVQRIYNSDHPSLLNSSTNIDVLTDPYTGQLNLRLETGGGKGTDMLWPIYMYTWYNAVLTTDSLQTKAYINGQLIQTVPFVNHHSSKGDSIAYLGANRDGKSNFFNGVLDDIRIYNRKITQEEIALFVSNDMSTIPETFYIKQNYPNPFNPSTSIEYGIAKSGNVSIIIYDVLGREVIKVVDSFHNQGHYKIIWDGMNPNKIRVASGMYYYILRSKSFIQKKKMVFIK